MTTVSLSEYKLNRLDFENIDINLMKEMLNDKSSSIDDIKALIRIKQTPMVMTKSGRTYYKSAWDATKKYYQQHKQDIVEKQKQKYKDNEEYRLRNKVKSRLRYYINKNKDIPSVISNKKEEEREEEKEEKKEDNHFSDSEIDLESDSDDERLRR